MKCSIKELKEGTTYYFLEADPNKVKDLKMYKATLVELNTEGRTATAMFDFEGLEKNQVFLMRCIDNPYVRDESNDPLDKITTLLCNHPDSNSAAILGTFMRPKGFMMSDSVENVIKEYHEFLDWSVAEGTRKSQEMIEKGQVVEGRVTEVRLGILKENYAKQIAWLTETYLNK